MLAPSIVGVLFCANFGWYMLRLHGESTCSKYCCDSILHNYFVCVWRCLCTLSYT